MMQQSILLVPIDERIARDAAEVRARRYHRSRSPLSLADCVLLAAASPMPDPVIATADRPLATAARAEGLEVNALPDARGRRP